MDMYRTYWGWRLAFWESWEDLDLAGGTSESWEAAGEALEISTEAKTTLHTP
jgi:hypothetical protein